jgi:hypothetical protein
MMGLVNVHGATRRVQDHLPGVAAVAKTVKVYNTATYARPNREPIEKKFMTTMATCAFSRLAAVAGDYKRAQRGVLAGMRRLSLRLELSVPLNHLSTTLHETVATGVSHGAALRRLGTQVFGVFQPVMSVMSTKALRVWYDYMFVRRLHRTMRKIIKDELRRGEAWQRAALRAVLVVGTVMFDGGVNRKQWAKCVGLIKSYRRHAGECVRVPCVRHRLGFTATYVWFIAQVSALGCVLLPVGWMCRSRC